MQARTAGVIGHIILDIILIPLLVSTGLGLLFAGTLGLSVQALAMGLILFAYVGFLVVDIALTLSLGLAPAGSRRATFYSWYMFTVVAWLVYGLCTTAGLDTPLAILCTAAIVAGLFLRRKLLRRYVG